MATAAPALAGVQTGLSELRNRLLFVLFALLVYRIGTHIPVPGINPDALQNLFDQNQGGILDLFNMFSGGALERMSILALGVMPYITSSIIMNLVTMMYPRLNQLRKEGEAGRRKITKYTRYGTLLISLVQGTALTGTLVAQQLPFEPGFGFFFISVVTLVTGALFMMWLGEKITEHGVGNGISLLIFAGIVSGFPGAIGQSFEAARQGDINLAFLLLIGVVAIGVVGFVVFIERGRTTHNYQLCEAPTRSQNGSGAIQPPSAQGQHGWCNSSNLRVESPVGSGLNGSMVRPKSWFGLFGGSSAGTEPRTTSLHHDVCRRNSVF